MQVVSHDEYNQLFTMHGSGMLYLVLVPVALALGVYLVPLQIGAARLAAAAARARRATGRSSPAG